jgi:hypothetical protein
METTYQVCALVGGTLIVCQFVLTLLGLGGHHDIAGHDHIDLAGHDGGGAEHHGSHGDNSTWFLGLLTFRTVTAALAFFGLVGIIGQRAELDSGTTIALASAAGAGALFLVGWIMSFLSELNQDGTVRIRKSLGCRGTVYISIPGDGAGLGKVQVSVLNRTMEYKAVAKQALSPGARIVVVEIVGTDTVEVAQDLE